MSHWRTMKKLGLTGTRPQPRKAKKEPGVPTKRRAATAEEIENGDEDADEGEPETPTKKAKKSV